MAASAPSREGASRLAVLRQRLRDDAPFYAEHCCKVVGGDGELVPAKPRRAQLELDAALEAQHAKGLPMRAIVLKARKLGFSTWVQLKILQKTTQNSNRRALTVAHDTKTASELFEMARTMYDNLPILPGLEDLRPPVASERNSVGSNQLLFGEEARRARQTGNRGINSRLSVDTAKEVQAGRGFTIHYLHCSEVAFWADPQKFTALLNAVPRKHGTMVVLESTANGYNHFKARWDRAFAGQSAYVPIFAAWHEEPNYALPFPSDEERERFVESIGTGPYGDDEPRLIEDFGCTPEQLYWRRVMIADECGDDLNTWNQEYPATPEEAFIATGHTVFPKARIAQVRNRTKETELKSIQGRFVGEEHRTLRTKTGTIEVPRRVMWIPDSAGAWQLWESPKLATDSAPLDARFVVGADVSGGLEDADLADHAVQVVNHHTGAQCAQYKSRCDYDELALEMLLAGLYFNHAWIAPEITGGWGLAPTRILALDYRYPRVYRRRQPEGVKQKLQDRLGWDTNTRTKPLMEAHMRALLRNAEGFADGIRSAELAAQLSTYIVDEKGRSGPSEGAHSDLLMAYMIAQFVASNEIWAPAVGDSGSPRTGGVINISTHRRLRAV